MATTGFYPHMAMEYFDEWVLHGRVAVQGIREPLLDDEDFERNLWQEAGEYKRYEDAPQYRGGASLGATEGTLVLEYGRGNLPAAFGKAFVAMSAAGHFKGIPEFLQNVRFYLSRNAEVTRGRPPAHPMTGKGTRSSRPHAREVDPASPLTNAV